MLLALVAAVGMVGFNLALLGAVEQIGATNTGVIVGASARSCSRSPPPRRSRHLLGCAGLVVAGAAIVNGVDPRLTAIGLALAVAALLAEVGFTLLAAPLIPRLGPMRVAAWACWLAVIAARAAHAPHPDADHAARPPRSPTSRSSPPRSRS